MRSARRTKLRAGLGAIALLAAEVGVLAASAVVAPPVGAVDAYVPGTRTYTDANMACQDGSYIVPDRVEQVKVIAIGAAGVAGEGAWRNGYEGDVTPGGAGGQGTKITTVIDVTPGEILGVGVAPTTMTGGRRGHTGTINAKYETAVGSGGKGGAASWVSRLAGCSPTPLVVAGGGGGGGGAGSHFDHTEGGAGGSAGSAGASGQGDGTHVGGGGGGDGAHGNGAGGDGGHGTITTAPFFINVPCAPGNAGRAGAGTSGGDGGSAAITDSYTSGCGRVKTAGGAPASGYIGDNSSGGGGGGGGGYPAGGGGGGADDARMAGGGGGAGGSYAGGAPFTAVPTTDDPGVTIIPVPIAPSFTGALTESVDIGPLEVIQVPVRGYPEPYVYAENLPPGVSFDNLGNGNGRFYADPIESAVGDHHITLHADNMAGSATVDFVMHIQWGPIDHIEVTPASPQLWAGYVPQQLDARVFYQNGYLRYATNAVTWSSTNDTVATVSATGLVRPKVPGSVDITAAIDGSSLKNSWTVVTGPATQLDITPKDSVLGLGEHLQLAAKATYAGGYQADVTNETTWSTGDPAVATIGVHGDLLGTGGSQGASTSVFASYAGTFGSNPSASPGSVTITLDRPVSIAVTPADQTMGTNENTQFTATGTFADGSTANITNKVTWTSSNTTAATMSGGTTGSAHSDPNTPGGHTTISASLNGKTGSTGLDVLGGTPTSMAVTPANPTLGLGRTQQLTVTATYGDGSTFDVTSGSTFTSDHPETASVSPTGLVTGTGHVRDGRARITVSFAVAGHPDAQAFTDVTLSLDHPTSIAITPRTPTVAPNASLQFTAIGTFPGGDTVDLTQFLVHWTSSNTSVGTIDDLRGAFRAGNAGGGTTTVTATSIDGVASASTVVTREIGNPVSLTITPGSQTIGLGETRQFSAIATYVDNSTVDVTSSAVWSTNGTAATVTPAGLVTATGAYPGDHAGIGARYLSPYGATVIAFDVDVTTTFDRPTSIAITPDAPTMFVGRNQTFTATGSYPDGSAHNITSIVAWSMPANAMAHLIGSTVYTETNSPGGTFTLTATRPDGTVSDSTDITSYSQAFMASSPGGLPPNVPTIRPQVTAPFTSAPFVGDGGSGSYTWAVGANGLPAGLHLSATTGASVTITGTPTTTGSMQTDIEVKDANDPLSSFRYVNINIDVRKLDQSITAFTGPSSGLARTQATVSAVGGGGTKPVVFSTTDSTCSAAGVNGSTIRLDHGSATCHVVANQASDALYNAAPTVQLDITVFATQTLSWTFSPLPSATVGKTGDAVYASVDYSEGGSGPGTPLVITVDPATTNGACTLGSSGYGAAVSYPHAGTCVIDVNKAGAGTFAPAVQLQETFSVGQVLSFTSTAPSTAKVGGTYTPVFRSTDPAVTPVLTIGAATTNAACALNGAAVRFDHVGSCSIAIDTPPSALFGPATTRTQTFTIAKGVNPITFAPAPTVAVDDAFWPSATAPGGPVTIAIGPGTTNAACSTPDGNDFYADHAGTCQLVASQVGTADWNAATATQTFTVAKAVQTLTFLTDAPAGALRGGDYTPTVSGGGSSNPIVVSIDPATTNAACSFVYSAYVQFDDAGTCVVRATQAGDADHLAASAVTQSFAVHVLHLGLFPVSDIPAGSSAHAEFGVALVDEANDVYVTPDGVTVALSSSSPGAIFAETDGGAPVGSVTIPAGEWFGEFWYGDAVAGVSTLTVGDGVGITPTTWDVNVAIGAAAQLAFVVQPADTYAGQSIPSFRVQVQDASGNPIETDGVTITLTPDHGTFSNGDAVTTGPEGATFESAILDDPGTYTLTATSDTGLTTTVSSASFVVRGAPVVHAVYPSSGNVAGGTVIFVGGSGFTGATDVRIGATSATWWTVDDDSHLTAIVPSGAKGAVDVTVSTPGGTSATSADDRFTYTADRFTATVLTSAASPTTVGQPVKLTARVFRYGPLAPTGLVQFWDDATFLGWGTPVSGAGVSTFTTTGLGIGQHALHAVYTGDAEYAASTSSALTQTVAGHATAVSLAAVPNPSVGAQTATFSAQVMRNFFLPMPTGTVTLMDGTTVLGTATLNNLGRATVTTTALAVGDHGLTMVYGGDAVYATTASSVLVQTITPRPSSLTLSSSLNPSNGAQAVTFLTTVTGSFFAPIPTGTVSLMDGSTVVASATLNAAGKGAVTTAALPAGSHSLTMVYGGDAVYGASTSPVVVQAVTGRASTVSIASNLNPSTAGRPVAFAAHVGRSFFGPAPTGSVTLLDGVTPIGTATVNALGNAVVTTAALAVGSHPLTMVYAGDAVYAGATSAVLSQVVDGRVTPVSLTSSSNPATAGDPVTFSTQVTRSFWAAMPTGTVTLLDGSVVVGTATLDAAGKARFTTSALAVGTHTMTVEYGGDAVYAAATSPVLTQEIAAPGALITVTPGTSSVPQYTMVHLTIAVTAPAGLPAPTGFVDLEQDGRLVFTFDQPNGEIDVLVPAGPSTIVIGYRGDENYAPATRTITLTGV